LGVDCLPTRRCYGENPYRMREIHERRSPPLRLSFLQPIPRVRVLLCGSSGEPLSRLPKPLDSSAAREARGSPSCRMSLYMFLSEGFWSRTLVFKFFQSLSQGWLSNTEARREFLLN